MPRPLEWAGATNCEGEREQPLVALDIDAKRQVSEQIPAGFSWQHPLYPPDAPSQPEPSPLVAFPLCALT